MITASIILYKTSLILVKTVMRCVENSCVERIFVIDNSPTDSLKDMVLPLSNKIEYIYGQGNIGYGAGHNIGIRKAIEAGAKYHVVLNPDIEFGGGAIEKLESFAEQHHDIGSIMPRLSSPDGVVRNPILLIPSPFDMFGRRLLPKSLMKKRADRLSMNGVDFSVPRNVPQLSGCFMFLRIEILKQIGGFDDRFFMYFEDFDLERRIHKVAKTVVYPDVTIVHNHASEHHVNKKLLKISIQSAIRYYNKWGWIFDIDRWRWNKEAFRDSSVIK